MKSYQPTIDFLIEKGYKRFSQTGAEFNYLIDRYEYWQKDKDNVLLVEVWKNGDCMLFKQVENI